jgi:hypothetical protein
MTGRPPIGGWARDPADELGANDGAGAIDDVASRHQPASDQNRHARAAAGPGRRAVDLAFVALALTAAG